MNRRHGLCGFSRLWQDSVMLEKKLLRGDSKTSVDRNTVDYRQALDAQLRLCEARHRSDVPDLLWLLEHPPTITFGTAGGEEHLLADKDRLDREGFEVVATRRGGDVTCHEPGQLVGYPLIDIGAEDHRDLHRHLRDLEEALLRTLAERYGVVAGRVDGRTGVWLDNPSRKIAAMGVRCARWVTSHGFALNVENRMLGFEHIVPCGIADAGVTRLADETSEEIDWLRLCQQFHTTLESIIDRPLRLLIGDEGIKLAAEHSDS